MNSRQVLFLALAFATWIGGGNLLSALHYRRRGQSWQSGFRPLAFPFPTFNVREKLVLAVLAVLTLYFFYLALVPGPT